MYNKKLFEIMDKEKALKSRVKNVLKEAEIIRYDENDHMIIDMTRLKMYPECELRKLRRVGNVIVEAINEFRKCFDWL